MTYLVEMDPVTGFVPANIDRKKGTEFREAYDSASPFPHAIIEDFLPPEILERCLAEFPAPSASGSTFDRDQERLKSQYNPDEMTTWTRNLFYGLQLAALHPSAGKHHRHQRLDPGPLFPGRGLS